MKGEEIPLGARMFAVADVYDALTSERPYHSPLKHDEAVSEIRKESGSHFDQRIVAAFESIAQELLQAVMKKNETMAENENVPGQRENKQADERNEK